MKLHYLHFFIGNICIWVAGYIFLGINVSNGFLYAALAISFVSLIPICNFFTGKDISYRGVRFKPDQKDNRLIALLMFLLLYISTTAAVFIG